MLRIGWRCYLGGYLDTWRVLLFLFVLPACVVWVGLCSSVWISCLAGLLLRLFCYGCFAGWFVYVYDFMVCCGIGDWLFGWLL